MAHSERGNDTAPDAILNLDFVGSGFDVKNGALGDTGKRCQFCPGKRFLFSDLLYSCHRGKDSKNIS
jgi:hypothetical protein